MSGEKRFLIVDGSSLVYRAFFALPLLQTRQGLYTNAVYGFTTMLLRLLDEEKPAFVAVAFDKGKATFRHEEYKEYKAKREKTPGELSEQLSYVRELLDALHIPVLEADSFEADDVIGTLATQANHHGISPLIVTGDADIFQLVDTPAEVIYTRKGITQTERYTEKELFERYGLTASQFIDYKALKGDTSDNIPGVPGVGDKTAVKLLTQYGSLERIYEHLSDIPGRLHELLSRYRDQAFLSKRLATIVRDMPLDFDETGFTRRQPDYSRLRVLFEKLEFKSLLEKLPEEKYVQAGFVREEAFRLLESPADMEALRKSVREAGMAAILTVPVSAAWQHEIRGLSISLEQETFYLPLPECKEQLQGFFRADTLHSFVYDAKNWRNICDQLFGGEPAGRLFDVTLAAYLLDPLENGYPPEKMASRYLGRELPASPDKKKGEGTPCEREYACAAARALYDLGPVLSEKLAEFGLDRLYYELELPLTATLARMERGGVAVDPGALDLLRVEFKKKIDSLEQDIYTIAGEIFNINSPKQLGFVLFEKLGLPALKKTKTGFSTDAEVLEDLAPHHEIAAKILEYRTFIKLLTTYVEGLSKLVSPDTCRIHTTFNQTVTATGRLSSTEPNLQNIPIRLEEGRRIRKAFVSGRTGKQLLLSADYSQIELRILAHISGDPVLIGSFMNNEDIHRRTAAEVFGVAPEDVTRELRDRAKAVNFGIVYGISDYGLSRQLGISRQEAKTYIDRYLERLPGVRDYIRNIIKEARESGYVTTILNRRRYLPDINNRNFNLRSFAERTAMNTPIQGSAADIIKLAMLRAEEALLPYGDAVRMILQVHDELVFEADATMVADIARVIRDSMEKAIRLTVPLTVDVKAGDNWAEMTKLDLKRE